MRPPHWLDGVIGDLRDEQDPKRLASTFEQEIRVAIVEAIKSEH
jgi:hypothetical protein